MFNLVKENDRVGVKELKEGIIYESGRGYFYREGSKIYQCFHEKMVEGRDILIDRDYPSYTKFEVCADNIEDIFYLADTLPTMTKEQYFSNEKAHFCVYFDGALSGESEKIIRLIEVYDLERFNNYNF